MAEGKRGFRGVPLAQMLRCFRQPHAREVEGIAIRQSLTHVGHGLIRAIPVPRLEFQSCSKALRRNAFHS